MKMRWNKMLTLIITVILSLAYAIVSLLNLIGPLHPRIASIKGPLIHPLLCLAYLVICLIISWSIYFYYRKKPSRFSFFLTVLVGIAFIFSGVFLWKFAIRVEDSIVPYIIH